jgi:hypothetical protein
MNNYKERVGNGDEFIIFRHSSFPSCGDGRIHYSPKEQKNRLGDGQE